MTSGCFNNFSVIDKNENLVIRYNYTIPFLKSCNAKALIKSIDLSNTKLRGEIPKEVSNLLELISLNLSWNNLIELIRLAIGQLKVWDVLDLSQNQLISKILAGLSQIPHLSILDLSNNNLSCKISLGTYLQSFNSST